MSLRMRFWRDERGTSFEGIALSVAIVAVAFVASADMLDYMTKAHHAGQTEFAAAPHQTSPTMASNAGNVDYTPTASIRGPGSLPTLISRSVLDPCTGASR